MQSSPSNGRSDDDDDDGKVIVNGPGSYDDPYWLWMHKIGFFDVRDLSMTIYRISVAEFSFSKKILEFFYFA